MKQTPTQPDIIVTSPNNVQTVTGSANCPNTDVLTPRDYADAVVNFTRLPSGAGQEYQQLADFLALPDIHKNERTNAPAATVPRNFATLYRFHHVASDDPQSAPAPNVTYFQSETEFDKFRTPEAEHVSQMLFMNGFPSAQWLRSIGARYEVDPEFFRRHLDLPSSTDRSNTYSSPCLPSSSWHLVQLPIYTIGIQHNDNSTIYDLRSEGVNALTNHHHKLRLAMANERIQYTCDPVVRGYHVLDENHFIIEQRISVCLQSSGGTYTLIVWIDSYDKWDTHEVQSWCPKSSKGAALPPELVPVIQYRRNMALMSHLLSPSTSADARGKRSSKAPPQSAAMLHIDYEKTLNCSIVAKDAFYALSRLFRFSASSMSQVLNLVNAKVNALPLNDNNADVTPQLKYNARIVYGILEQIQEVQQSMANRKHPEWPKAPVTVRQNPLLTATGLEADLKCLLDRAQMIYQRSNSAISVVMNSLAIAESREAIVQAKRVSRLTFLAFIFVPLSFTTSFFGMNVLELEAERLGIWVWFAVSIPILALAMSFLYKEFWNQVITELRRSLSCNSVPEETNQQSDP